MTSIDWPVFEDERGTLVPIEFDSVPFAVERAFFVRISGARRRGDHVTSCDELVVLVDGAVRLWAGSTDPLVLDRVGSSFHILAGTFLTYEAVDDNATIMVLAAEKYRGRRL